VKTLDFASAMETSIAEKMRMLQVGCTVDLTELLDRLIKSQQSFVDLIQQAKNSGNEALELKIDVTSLIGSDAEWAAITAKFQPGDSPVIVDATTLWSVHAMLDKASQFYLQASKQLESPQLRLFFSNLAEIKLMLRRRVGAVERILANQIWQEIGFPPGLLGKE
jgi:hypothetical protein